MLEGCTPFPPEFAERYIRTGFWRAETIPQAIVNAGKRRPDAIALVDSTRSITFSQLLDEAGKLATLLDREGIVR
ncbi:MAG TPA: 2,3-dihydroxybenzoate-AMP ligase, partial [Methylomirabilota bacterium]|nr:2,3-dihydroxybenzoate-AMP ligase [Methylomirabilota bacterium]